MGNKKLFWSCLLCVNGIEWWENQCFYRYVVIEMFFVDTLFHIRRIEYRPNASWWVACMSVLSRNFFSLESIQCRPKSLNVTKIHIWKWNKKKIAIVSCIYRLNAWWHQTIDKEREREKGTKKTFNIDLNETWWRDIWMNSHVFSSTYLIGLRITLNETMRQRYTADRRNLISFYNRNTNGSILG